MLFVNDNLRARDRSAKKHQAQFFVEDRGICRVYSHYLELFAAAGLKIVEVVEQDQWPHILYPLFCFVLQ
jgi:hypothetical protein